MKGMKDALGNSFHGYIYEFPGIKVDNFDKKDFMNFKSNEVEFSLLTHAHADHMKGLENNIHGKKIYCSVLTKNILKTPSYFKYHKSLPYLTPLDENVKHQIKYKNEVISLTVIPSNHCAGSVMFLIEGRSKSVLLSGDIKAESWWVESLSKNIHLFPYTTSLKQLDNIYLDTTYGYRGEPYILLPSNIKGLQELVDVIKKYPDDPDVNFHFHDKTLGFEDCWTYIASTFQDSLHICSTISKRINCLMDENNGSFNGYSSILTDNSNAKFHVCERDSGHGINKFNVRVKACIDISTESLLEMNSSLSKQSLNDLKLERITSKGHKVLKRVENGVEHRYLSLKDSDILLRNEILFVYSRHSSYDECRNFVSQFNVGQVFPLTESPKVWMNGFQMKRHFGDLCNDNEFIYDEIYSSIYGPIPLIADRPSCVDKLTRNQESSTPKCLTVENLLMSKSFSFRGQQQLNNAFSGKVTRDQRDVINQYAYLSKQNHVLTGVNQYKFEKKVKAQGYDFLSSRNQDNYSDHNNSDTDESMTSFEKAFLSHAQREANVATLQRGPIKNANKHIGAVELKSANLFSESNDDVYITEIREVNQTSTFKSDHQKIEMLKREIISSPKLSPPKKLRLDTERIASLSRVLDQDLSDFGFEIQSCAKYQKELKTLQL